jgi:hypothetical protein
MSAQDAQQAASLWGGDAYVAWSRGSTPCVRLAMLARSVSDQPALQSALQAYARAVDASVSTSSNGGPTTVTSCG